MKENRKIQQEFEDFLRPHDGHPSQKQSLEIRSLIHAKLHPSSWFVFLKLFLIHTVTSLVTLSFCSQFGVRLFGEGHGLTHYFMYFGSYGCVALCGAFLMGTSFFVASLILKSEEIKTVYAGLPLYIGVLIILSLSLFMIVSSDILVGYALTWIGGAIVGSFVLFNVGTVFKKRIYSFS